MSSSHHILSALALAHASAPHAQLVLVPPDTPALSDPFGLVAVGDKGVLPLPPLNWRMEGIVPYNTPGSLVLRYGMETSLGAVLWQRHAIRGPFTRADIALLLGTLLVGSLGRFIPSQVGLPDPIDCDATGEDADGLFEDDDIHPWCELRSIDWAPNLGTPSTWSALGPVFLARNKAGYDPDSCQSTQTMQDIPQPTLF